MVEVGCTSFATKTNGVANVAPLKGMTLFSLLFFIWYGPLFFVVFFYNTVVIPLFGKVFGDAFSEPTPAPFGTKIVARAFLFCLLDLPSQV